MSIHESQRLRDLRFLLFAMGLSSLPLGYTLVVFPIYLNEIGFSSEVIGVTTAASALASTIASIPFALAADRYGRKKFALSGFLLATLAYVLFAFSRDLNSVLLASAIGGVGLAGGFSSAVWTPAWTALLAEKTRSEDRARAFAWAQGIWTLALTTGSGMSVIPAFFRSSLQMSFLESFQYAFLIFAAFALLSGLVILPVREAKRAPSGQKKFYPRKSTRQIYKFSVTLGLVGLASGISVQLLSLWFKEMYDVNEAVLGPWFAAAEITSLVVVPIVPRLTRNLGSPLSVLVTQGLSAVILGSMIFAPTYQLAGLIFIVRNFFMNISWPVQQSYLMGTVTAQERASASAITATIWGAGSSVGPLFAGYFLGRSGFIWLSAPLVLGGTVYLASAIIFYFLFRGTPPPEEVGAPFSSKIAERFKL